MTDKIKALHVAEVQKGVCVTNYSSFKAGYLAAQKEASEQKPVALLLMGIGVNPSIRSTCGCVCVSEEEAEEYTPQCILKLYAAPVNLEAERQKDAALIEKLKHSEHCHLIEYGDLLDSYEHYKSKSIKDAALIEQLADLLDKCSKYGAGVYLPEIKDTFKAVEEWRKK